MSYIQRNIKNSIEATLDRGKSILLLGPRQTGKTTLVKSLNHHRYINLMNPEERIRYEADPGAFIHEIKALNTELQSKPIIIIDEIQKVPNLTDTIQILIDDKISQFILTGSSARKIKNLLPGRVIKYQLDPLSLNEIEGKNTIDDLLIYGSLPEIFTMDNTSIKEQELESYVTLYLEEEVRKEALVRNLGAFSNFLRLASIESGNIVSFRNISSEIGVSHSTISEYYRILQDCMLIEKIEPLTITTTRKKLSKIPKYILFDLGVRRVAAKESSKPTLKQLSVLFEQFIGLEILKIIRVSNKKASLLFWRDHAGPEVDFVIEHNEQYIPIEVKWTSKPSEKDARNLATFKKHYPITKCSYIICQTPFDMELNDFTKAISWKKLHTIFSQSIDSG